MSSDRATTLVFGNANPTIKYVPRAAAYAVITDQKQRIAAVKGTDSYFLPGGGSLVGETGRSYVSRMPLLGRHSELVERNA